nr:LacI family DNA-binding transcriptional regulator [Aquisalinus luteolus]
MSTEDEAIEPVAAAEEWRERHGSSRKPTINDVARIAGVSKRTVSRVINNSPLVKEKTRTEIGKVIDIVGFSPDPQARGLAFRHSYLIGMIYDNPNPQYVVNMQQGILAGLNKSGHELVLHPCDRESDTFLQDVRQFIERLKLFGVILTPSVSEDERIVEMLREIGCAYIRIASVALEDNDNMIVSNDRIGGREAGRHLAGLGHERIGFISGKPSFRSSRERRAGFEEALAERGLTLDPALVRDGAYTFQSGLERGRELLQMDPRPTAIFAANDEMAVGVLQALSIAGLRVPDDMSIMGYDDFQISISVWPRITTVHSPVSRLGELAAEKLLLLKEQEGLAGGDETCTPWLIERESTAAPRK